MPSSAYVLGHSSAELSRLIAQSRYYGELTEDILRRAGLERGMRVLDVGCGAGDVSFVARSLVGPEGSVLGVDKAEGALAMARSRAEQAGLANVSFASADLDTYVPSQPFDAVVGRLVLPYVRDRAGLLRRLGEALHERGIVAFVELELSTVRTVPHLPLFHQVVEWLKQAFVRAGAETDMGTRLHATFVQAGLPAPSLLLLGRVDAGEVSTASDQLVETIRSLLPALQQLGIASAQDVQIDTLAARLRAEARAVDAVIIPPCAIGAWTRKP